MTRTTYDKATRALPQDMFEYAPPKSLAISLFAENSAEYFKSIKSIVE
ncbi:hypothetical protein [Pseudomonas sp. PDM27]|nr:hypothetical protein [Pseudomonas sp. PDM27]MBV7565899.1 hypothetical protein [Pseudomonas sp. PDM27]